MPATVAGVIFQVSASVVEVADDGNCSLIEAILHANQDGQVASSDCPAGSGHDVIALAPGSTYELATVYQDFYGPTGLPVIDADLDVIGNGASIVRAANGPRMRLISICGSWCTGTSIAVSIAGVTLADGWSPDGASGSWGGDGINGGAVYLDGAILTIDGSTFSGNRAGDGGEGVSLAGGSGGSGGAIFAKNSSVVIQASSFFANQAGAGGVGIPSGSAGQGGAVAGATSLLEIDGSQFVGNQAGQGGALYVGSAQLTVDESYFANNHTFSVAGTAGGGGAVSLFDTATTIAGTSFELNSTGAGGLNGGPGGAVYANYHHLVVNDCQFTMNSTGTGALGQSGPGGALAVATGTAEVRGSLFKKNSTGAGYDGGGGGAVFLAASTMTIATSSIVENSTGGGASDAGGGGLHASGSSLMLDRTLVAANTTGDTTYPGGGGGAGAGIAVDNGMLHLRNATVSGNTTGKGNPVAGQGGGVYLSGTQAFFEFSTIAFNSGSEAGGLAVSQSSAWVDDSIIASNLVGADCAAATLSGSIGSSDGTNLVGDGSCPIGKSGDAGLAPLANHGGPTQTHALCVTSGVPDASCLATSNAIDAGSTSGCASVSIDQRGYGRGGAGKGCDIGAYELNTPGISLSVGVGRPGGLACVAATLAAGQAPSSTSNSIEYDALRFVPTAPAINPAIGSGTMFDKLAELSVSDPGTATITISGSPGNPLPPGPLYMLAFNVDPAAGPGFYPLLGTPGGGLQVTTCTGDCNGNGTATIGELQRCVNLFLGQPLCDPANVAASCPVADVNLNGIVSIGELQQCVGSFLNGCPT